MDPGNIIKKKKDNNFLPFFPFAGGETVKICLYRTDLSRETILTEVYMSGQGLLNVKSKPQHCV